MTTNQIAYQANKLREEENAIKRDAQAVKLSEHLHEYGSLETMDSAKNWWFEGNANQKAMSEVLKNYAQSLGAFGKLV